MTRLLRLSRLLALAALLVPLRAHALQNLEGHVTDPQHRLSANDRSALEKKLGDIQSNTHIDVACWISDLPADQARQQGEDAYRRWGIGRAWDNGVFFMFPASGRVQVILNPRFPELNASEVARVTAADNPSVDMARRLEQLADATNAILLPKVKTRRPQGHPDLAQGRRYGAGAALVALAALALAFSGRGRGRVA